MELIKLLIVVIALMLDINYELKTLLGTLYSLKNTIFRINICAVHPLLKVWIPCENFK